MTFEIFGRAYFLFGGVFEKHRAVGGAEINRGNLDAGSGKAEKIPFAAS